MLCRLFVRGRRQFATEMNCGRIRRIVFFDWNFRFCLLKLLSTSFEKFCILLFCLNVCGKSTQIGITNFCRGRGVKKFVRSPMFRISLKSFIIMLQGCFVKCVCMMFEFADFLKKVDLHVWMQQLKLLLLFSQGSEFLHEFAGATPSYFLLVT